VQFENPEAVTAVITPDRPAALLENDGVLVAGRTVLEAFDRLEVLESTAEAIINCRAIGAVAPMPDEVTRELDRVFLKQ
jgi:L-fuculose-phosphate aldolase